jgi:fructose-specific phosphotransferase system IIC component
MEVTVKITTLLNLITGFFGSYVIQIIKKYGGVEGQNAMVLTLVFSLTIGCATSWIAGEFTSNAYNSCVQVLASAPIVYQFLIKKN